MVRKLIIGLAGMLALTLTSSASYAEGVFMVVKGDVKVEKPDKKVTPAKVGMKVLPSDTIIAGKDSRAKVVMKDKNVLNISPESKILIEKYESSADAKNVTLNVLYGKVRSTVNQKYDGEKSKFHVKTPSAVAGVRGTDFLTQFSPSTNQAKFVTFEGKVEVGQLGAGGAIVNSVFVNPGQSTSASAGGQVAQPTAVPKNELAKMEGDTKADPGSNDRQPASPSGGEPKGEGEKKGDGSSNEKKSEGAGESKEAKSEPKSEGQGDGKSEAKNEPKGDAKAEAKNEPKGEGKNEPKGQAGNEPKGEAKSEPKSQAGTEPKGDPKGNQSGPAGGDKAASNSNGGTRSPASTGGTGPSGAPTGGGDAKPLIGGNGGGEPKPLAGGPSGPGAGAGMPKAPEPPRMLPSIGDGPGPVTHMPPPPPIVGGPGFIPPPVYVPPPQVYVPPDIIQQQRTNLMINVNYGP